MSRERELVAEGNTTWGRVACNERGDTHRYWYPRRAGGLVPSTAHPGTSPDPDSPPPSPLSAPAQLHPAALHPAPTSTPSHRS